MRIIHPAFYPPSERIALEALARSLAEQDGVNWEALQNYPGYGKNIWREMAERLTKRHTPTVPRLC
jgi:hypothetical protein